LSTQVRHSTHRETASVSNTQGRRRGLQVSTLGTLDSSLADKPAHGFNPSLLSNWQTAQPMTPTPYPIRLRNTGTASTNYDLAVSGLPAGVTAASSQPKITVGSGRGTSGAGLSVTLTSTSATLLPAFNFLVTATAEGAAEITRSTTGVLVPRAEAVSVVSIAANPPFTEPGNSVDVKVPHNAGASLVPGSFNVAPASITAESGFDPVEWTLNLDASMTTQTITYQTQVTGLQPAESRPVTLGATVGFTSGGFPGSLDLLASTVVGRQIVGVFPASQTTPPGQSASYFVRLMNPSAADMTYQLSTLGVPTSWSDLPASMDVAAGTEADFRFNLTPAPATSPATRDFSVVAAVSGGVAGSSAATLVVAGSTVIADAQSHGVVATLTPVRPTGRSCSGRPSG